MHQQSHRGMFITIEGIEGVGKSTAVRYIQGWLTEAKIKYLVTREPGGTEIAEEIRRVLLKADFEESMVPVTELLLMFASRAQHVANLIEPALASGKWVVSDRFIDATYAYQGGGRRFDVSQIEALEKWVVGKLKPDVTILLDAPPKLGLARARHRGPQDRIEQERVDFFERVRDVYLARAKQDSKRFRVIDATQPLAIVHAEIKKVLDHLDNADG